MASATSTGTGDPKSFADFEKAGSIWPRGDRLEAVRTAATEFRRRFTSGGPARGVRTADLVSTACPVRNAFGGTARAAVSPYVTVVSRLVVVQFEGFDGELRTLCWNPTALGGSSRAPFYAHLGERYGEWLSARIACKELDTPASALERCGLSPADVDYVAFGNLHGQDLRTVIGTTQPVERELAPRAPLFPNARHLLQSKEVDTLRSPHPMQSAWYVPGGMDHVIEDGLVLLDGDVELGVGVALAATPGSTDGSQSLVVHTPEGVWVASGNGVAADNWHPHLSKIPGLRREAELLGREVIPGSNAIEDSLDLYDSMVKEKALADANAADPRWLNVLPSAELASLRRQWPFVPSFRYGGIQHGRIERPRRGR